MPNFCREDRILYLEGCFKAPLFFVVLLAILGKIISLCVLLISVF